MRKRFSVFIQATAKPWLNVIAARAGGTTHTTHHTR